MEMVRSESLRSRQAKVRSLLQMWQSKAGGIKIGFVDRFNGTLIITGEVASVEAAMNGVIAKLCDYMGFAKPEITQS